MNTTPNIPLLQQQIAYGRDERAYKEVFYHFHPRLFRFCYKLTRHAEPSEELASDVLLQVWLMGNKLANIENLQVYLFKAIKNSAFTYLKKNNNTPVYLDRIDDNITGAYSSEAFLMATETHSLLEKAVTSLPIQCQTVFRLIREEGFSYKEVSQVLGITQNTIETYIRIALKPLPSVIYRLLS